jgi:hypothetical protein
MKYNHFNFPSRIFPQTKRYGIHYSAQLINFKPINLYTILCLILLASLMNTQNSQNLGAKSSLMNPIRGSDDIQDTLTGTDGADTIEGL